MNWIHWISKNIPQPVLSIIRPVYSGLQDIIDRLKYLGDSLGLIGPDQIYDEDYYSKRRNDPWRSDARNVSTELNEYFEPNSVIDFGCAIGAYLEPFYQKDICIKGIEGNSDAFDYAVVPQEHLEKYDLRNEYTPEKKYDLALCFELAEHLPKKYSDNLIESLTSSSDLIIMTAATPGQGGTHHVNEQPHEYWHKKLEARGYAYASDATEDLRSRFNVEKSSWIAENLMVFYNTRNRALPDCIYS